MSNCLEFVEIDFAIAKAGMVKAPMNPRLVDDERAFILANCGAEVLVTEESELERVEAIRGDLPDLRHVVVVDREDSYADLLARASGRRPDVVIDPDGPSMILHTSGTTGRPKGATTSQRARVAANLNMLLDEFSAGPDDGMVHVAPMSHGSGSKILAYFMRGARNITLPKFDPATFLHACTDVGRHQHVRRAHHDPDAARLAGTPHAGRRPSGTSPTAARRCRARWPRRRSRRSARC